MTTTTALKIVDQLGFYAGTMYVTTIKHTPEKKTTAWSAVAKELNAPAELIAKHTKVTYNILAAETKALSN